MNELKSVHNLLEGKLATLVVGIKSAHKRVKDAIESIVAEVIWSTEAQSLEDTKVLGIRQDIQVHNRLLD